MFFNLSGKTFCLSKQEPLLQQITDLLYNHHTTLDNFSFFSNGKLLQSFDNLQESSTISAVVPLKGGKGGYGAKLKTEGGKKVRPNDNMFSRDIHGQKVIYATMEKQYREFIIKKIEQDKHVERERQQFKLMESALKEGQSFTKLDRAYKKQIETTEKNLAESIMIGRQKLMEKYKLEAEKNESLSKEKVEIKEEVEQVEEGKIDNDEVKQESVKRDLPAQFKEEFDEKPEKKQKTEEEEEKPAVTVAKVEAKPAFLSAQQKFKLLFKKK